MDSYRCECGTLCRPTAEAREFTCLDCRTVRTEQPPADIEPEAQPVPEPEASPARARAEKMPEPPVYINGLLQETVDVPSSGE